MQTGVTIVYFSMMQNPEYFLGLKISLVFLIYVYLKPFIVVIKILYKFSVYERINTKLR